MAEKKYPGFRRAVKTILVLAIVYFFVLPLIPGFREALDRIGSVNKVLLAAGLALETAALFAYTLLTRAALGDEAERVSALRLFRIQLSTKALGNIMPGGSAASSALGYRLITMNGVPGPDTGFALATAGIGSAVVLNFVLWFGLILSIPGRGVNPFYGTAAIVGVLFMAFAAFLVIGLMEGQGRAERVVRAIARRIRYDEKKAADVIQHLGLRIEGLIRDRQLLRRVVGWALANWLLDAAALWVFLRAFGGSMSVDGLIVAFGLANVMSVIPITPGGLGIVEGIYIPTLVAFGLTRSNATVGVLAYRVVQFWLPILVGWLCYLSLRVGPWSIDRLHKLRPLPELVDRESRRGLSNIDFVETYAPRDRTGQIPVPRLDEDEQ